MQECGLAIVGAAPPRHFGRAGHLAGGRGLCYDTAVDLFDDKPEPPEPADGGGERPAAHQPLAERMRPRSFDDWIGQAEVAGPDSPLRRMLARGALHSLILWGPPGCGKTTLARLIAGQTDMAFQPLSAVISGIKEVKAVIDQAKARLALKNRRTILFIDEIHRFNKAQQDAFLPHVENGTILLIGATTENPSFSVIAPLLSRCRVLTLRPLDVGELVTLLERALRDAERGLGAGGWRAEPEVLERIAGLSDGDARRALSLLEQCVALAEADPSLLAGDARKLTVASLAAMLERKHLLYDRGGEEHFNLISAFHKSMRASDPQGAVYWLFRMLEAGEDPLWIARRILAAASEDVGMADPQALQVAVAAYQAFQALGLPEGELPLTHAAIYVATAPKSNSVNVARGQARDAVRRHGSLPVPLHLRNAPTGLMKQLGYGREYLYDHDQPDHFSGQPTLPDELEAQEVKFYEPGQFGFEKEIRKRMDWWDAKRAERRS
ncbi:MAG TPA: replication-associated recombination protein A [Candidatus Sumerlaeota bacterium]|nr:MAG: Replication-associated recombination protein A [candidate division BRC1 bacterium ADurb.BinA292]HOE95669.1 replication-associated recombination protein A [Candidatus Sumerlaeota bacterium]